MSTPSTCPVSLPTFLSPSPSSSKPLPTTPTPSTPSAPSTSLTKPPFPEIIKGSSFLLAWRLQSRRVLLIGGGLVASGRLYYLLEAGAHVTLVSPRARLHPEVAYRVDVSNTEDITYLDREFLEEGDDLDVKDFDMVLTAIDSVGLSRSICLLCRAAKTPVNVADVPPECDFYFGSQLRRGPLQIMVSTSGRGPKIASLVRKRIEEGLPGNVEEAIESVGLLRSELRKRAPGTGGELGQRRMGWMIGICDSWTLEDLCLLTPALRRRLLEDGWEHGGTILTPRDLGVRGWRVWGGRWVDLFWNKCPIGVWGRGRKGERWIARVEGGVWGALIVGGVWAGRHWGVVGRGIGMGKGIWATVVGLGRN